MSKRKRSCYSKKLELLKKSQESALAAIQIFNNPQITFKSESFIVLMVIAWTYLLHSYYKSINIDPRYFTQVGNRKRFDKTKHGAFKHWELERCLNEDNCPLEKAVKDNLKFLIGIRHEIEHQMTGEIEASISAKFQACCINYNNALKSLFDGHNGIDGCIPIALQLFSFGEEQVSHLKHIPDLPKNILEFVSDFEEELDTASDPKYAYRVVYVRTNVNHPNQADMAYRFIPEDSQEGKEIHNILIKTKMHTKRTQNEIVEMMQSRGFTRFNKTSHQKFWTSKWQSAKIRNREATRFGELVVKTQWLWYEETWLPEVKKHCEDNRTQYV
jgi:hypothetical protein